MCHFTPTVLALQQAIPHGCPAKALPPSQRLTIGLHALAGPQSITGLADEFDVSRKFVYQQAATAQAALEEAFTAATADEPVLFHLPVTKNWLRQVTLGLLLICHSSYRGVVEFCRDLLDVQLSSSTVHNIVATAIEQARSHHLQENLNPIDIAALDEIFQNGQPVFVGADVASSYCFLLSHEEHRDSDTWAIRLLEAQERGFAPRATIADFGTGLRAGLAEALPATPRRGDVFHAACDLTTVVTYLENRAYQAIAARDQLQQQKAKRQQQGQAAQTWCLKIFRATQVVEQALALADDVAVLARWLTGDVFAVSGLPYADRCQLFDFITAELQARVSLCPQQLRRLCKFLSKHRDELLAFAAQLDGDVAQLAATFQVSIGSVRALLDLETLDPSQPRYWAQATVLQQQLGGRFYHLQQAVQNLLARVVRASSVVENLNSRLRNYFFLRRHVGTDYLVLLQFFLNHRRFLRSEHAERVGHSPAELLTGATHPHWLEMLGYTRFSLN